MIQVSCDGEDDGDDDNGGKSDDDDSSEDDDDNDNNNDDDKIPLVEESYPPDNDTEIDLYPEIRLTFSIPMNTSSVEEGFSLTKTSSKDSVEGDTSWNEDRTEFTFAVDRKLTEDTQYKIILDKSAVSEDGIELPEGVDTKFETVDLWTLFVDGSSNTTDYGFGIALDPNGNAIVTGGLSNLTGITSWTASISNKGIINWENTNTPFVFSRGNDVAVDNSGNIFVTGKAKLAGESPKQIWFGKYLNDGTDVWKYRVDTGSVGDDSGEGIALGQDDHFYIAGRFIDLEDLWWNIWAGKYETGSGNHKWTLQEYELDNDMAFDIALDSTDNIYIVGDNKLDIQESTLTGWLGKFDSNGVKQWSMTPEGVVSCRGIATDSNHLYLTGYSDPYTGDIWIGKFDQDGTLIWQKTIDHNGMWDGGFDIAVDEDGYIYVVGLVGDTYGMEDVWIGKLSSAGDLVWAQHFGATAANGEAGYALALDQKSNIYVIGNHQSQIGGDWSIDIWVRKFDKHGNWSN